MPRAPRIRNPLSGVQERFERTPVGEVAISVLVSVILLIAIVWSMPDSELRRTALPILEPVALTSGLDQSWYMFAPDPYRRLETVEIQVITASGDERVWDFPKGNLLDQFTWYRWHKLKEQGVKVPEIRAGIVRWAASQVLEPSDYPAEVSMVLTTMDFLPPGETGDSLEGTEVLYAETLTSPP